MSQTSPPDQPSSPQGDPTPNVQPSPDQPSSPQGDPSPKVQPSPDQPSSPKVQTLPPPPPPPPQKKNSAPKSNVFEFVDNKKKEDGSDLISIQNFDIFLTKVYRDVLFSYHSFLRFSDQPLTNLAIQFVGLDENKFTDFKKTIESKNFEDINRILMNISKKQVDEIKKKIEEKIKKNEDDLSHFYNEYFPFDSDKKNLLNQNQRFAKDIFFNYQENIVEFLEYNINQLKEKEWYGGWVQSLKIKILNMSKVYANFKKSESEQIEETFHLLRYHYSEVIERIKKKDGCGFIFILDDIFLRVFKWADKKPQSNADSILLRNAFSHFNIVYDKQSLNDAGHVFEKIFLKSNTKDKFEKFKDGLRDHGYSNINQRIIFYNIKDKDSLEADAMLDTNCYQVCRYFMTFCHCLYAIFSYQLCDVPFSQTLLEQFGEAYGLEFQGNSSKSLNLRGIKIKYCTIKINEQEKIIKEEEELNEGDNLTITSDNDQMEFIMTTFCNLTVVASGDTVTLDDFPLKAGQAQTIFSGIIKINSSKFFKIEDRILTINQGIITTSPIKKGAYSINVQQGGELNIRGKSVLIKPKDTSLFSVRVRGDAKTTFGHGTISCNKNPITFSKNTLKIFPSSDVKSECNGNLSVETSEDVVVENPTLVTIKCITGSIQVDTIDGFDMNENDEYIRFYTHKTNYMESAMNQKYLNSVSPASKSTTNSPSNSNTKSPPKPSTQSPSKSSNKKKKNKTTIL
ncbi:hypothetical protein ACTFIZ_001032 [Dictyostelium cf. discoideum]